MMKHNNDHINKVLASPKLISKDTSTANSSCRVYYDTAAVGVPFMWESQPGTPKHPLSQTSLPPLTPPPSYNNTSPKHYASMQRSNARANTTLLDYLTPRAMKSRKDVATGNMSPPTYSSASWSSSSSSSWSLTTPKGTDKRYDMVSRVPFGYEDEDDDEDVRRSRLSSPISTLCNGIRRRGSEYLRRCNSVRKIKFPFMSNIASHDHSRRNINY